MEEGEKFVGTVDERAAKGISAAVRALLEAAQQSREKEHDATAGYNVVAASPFWVRGPASIDYDSGEVVLDESRADTGYVEDGEGLLFELAGLADGDPAQNTLAFVRRYGLLWHGAGDVSSGKCRESIDDWFYAVGTLRFAMALYQSFKEYAASGSPSDPIHALGLELALPEEIVEEATKEDYVQTAGTVVCDLITKGLEGCRPQVGFEAQQDGGYMSGNFLFAFAPSNLLAAAYAEFATLVGTRAEIKECPGCGRLFSPKSGKQKYHSESCASTSRWRRWKESQAEK